MALFRRVRSVALPNSAYEFQKKLPFGSFYFGGWGEIRTHELRKESPVFKTGAFNRSATHPR